MNILIIDDDFLVAGALKTILETQEDFHVPACGSDGSEAAALFRQHRPDVLLMDIRMKDMNGLDASAEILREFPEARILLLTTFSDDEYIIKALKLGCKGVPPETGLPKYRACHPGRVFGPDRVRRCHSLEDSLTSPEAPAFDYASYDINDENWKSSGS